MDGWMEVLIPLVVGVESMIKRYGTELKTD